MDTSTLAAEFWVRTAAALVGAGAGLWLAAVAHEGWTRGLGVAATGFAVLWFAHGLSQRTRALGVVDGLCVDVAGISLPAAGTGTRIEWSQVNELRVDEDRLVVTIATNDGATHVVQPNFGALGVYDLHDLLSAAREAASASDASAAQRG